MDWTEQQKDAIEARGQNLLVSAAAGSGKTAVLTERVAKLAEEGTDLSRMLIITFTNAAAAEMKQRISDRVPLSVLTKYSISTFNKFAIEIYKSYYHVIGMPPGLAVCDEYKQEILKSEALDEMFEELFETENEDFREFLRSSCSAKSNDAARGMITSLYDFTRSMPDPEGWLSRVSEKCFVPEELAAYAASVSAADIDTAVKIFEEADSLLAKDPQAMPRLRAINQDDISRICAIRDLLREGRANEARQAFSGFKYNTIKAPKTEEAAFLPVKDEFGELRAKAKKLVKDAMAGAAGADEELLAKEQEILQPHIRRLCAFTADFAARYSKKKLAAGLMDFSDAEHFALRILEDESVRAELKEKYEYIFIDEYQDSNYVQEELVRRISRGNNVFLVGDVKQSIYKFRLAEPEIFIEKYKFFKTGSDPLSRVIDLNSNFRSKPEVIDLVNSVFSRVMTEDTAGMEYDDDAALVAGAPYSGPYRYQPKLSLIPKKPDEDEDAAGSADDTIAEMKAEELEALNAARLIKQYHGRIINTKDGDRPLRYSDMAILLRFAKSRGEVFYEKLTEQGIPVYLERGEGYFDTPEIKVLLSLLKITDDPRQDVELLSVMHFPSQGFSSAELAEIRIFDKDRKRSFYDVMRAFAAEEQLGMELFPKAPKSGRELLQEKVRAFLSRLSAWHEKAAALPLGDLVWELMHESGIASYVQALPGGQQRIANLRAMADRAESYENETAGGIGGFVSYIEMIAGSGKVDTGQVRLLTQADDVVRIMTVHKSKGLEFPLVILAGLGGSFKGRPDYLPLRRHRDLGISLKISDPGRGIRSTPESFRIIDGKLRSEEFAENVRILYVAMTRARDILLMSAVTSDAYKLSAHRPLYLGSGRSFMKNYLSMVLPSLPASCLELVPFEQAASAPGLEAAAEIRLGIEQGFAIDSSELPVSEEELRRRIEFPYAPDQALMKKRKYSVSEILEEQAPPIYAAGSDEPLSLPKKPGVLTGAEKGSAYHCVMEHIPFTPKEKDEASIARFIEDLRQRHILTDDEAQAVDPERIKAFFDTELAKRAMASSGLFRETPFVMRTLLDGREVFVQGVIDCFFEEGGEYVLLDYKSNYTDKDDPEGSKEKLRQHYLPQLTLYKEALEGISGKKVKQSCLYLFSLDDFVDL